ncbi:MAG: acyltransferase domain-containing protein, partial [Anaerolineae bacterium]|nr:acyltransferase domain-containing protein [Anaerolineae bacterium]
IRGSAVNNDGHSGDYLATPAQAGQEDMLRKAYASAGVSPGRVSYVEAHGTGTRAGDPIELGALGAVLAEGRPAGSKCVVGSVKTNIGHTEGAAGLAGLIKTVLSLQQRTLPATLHFQEPSPNIPWSEIPLEIRPQISHFPDSDQPIIAGVSAFGIAGTNAHVVLEEAPRRQRHEIAQPPESYLLPLSARSREALLDLARRYAAFETPASLYDVAFTASARRTHHEYRLGLVAHTWDDLRERLTAFSDGENRRGVAVTPENLPAERKIAFVFSGQGGQWVGMGRALAAQEPVFRQALEACDAAMQPYTGWSLLAELNAGEDESRLDEIDVIQPVIFAVQVALAALWRSWGVEPHGIIGHSMGEVAAAYVAGILSLDDAAHVICRRSQLMKQVSGQGAMALVELTYAAAEQIITAGGYSDRLGIAVNNGPTSTVLSGDPAALQEVVAQLEAQGVFCRFVKVDVAAHSPHMDRLRPLLVDDLKGLQAAPEQISIFSTVRGEWLSGESFDAAYWGQNLRQPVRFAAGIEAALAEGFNTFIEFSPHPVLLSAIERGYGAQAALLTLPSTRREEDERAVMLESLGALYATGYNVDWSRLYPEGGETVALPTYPWQKERFWYADDLQTDSRRSRRDAGGHPLLGVHLRTHTRTHYWETELELAGLDYLNDHRVRGQVVLPAAAYAEIALAAAHEALGGGIHRLADMTFTEALFLTDEIATMQVIITPESERRASFQIITLQGDSWVQHAQGAIITEAEITAPVIAPPSTVQARLGQLADGRDHYLAMTGRGLHYGSAFQGIGGFAVLDGEALAALNLSEAVQSESREYQIHPALLDACFQLLLDTLPPDDTATYLPVAVESLSLLDRPAVDEALYAYAVRTENPAQNTLQGDVYLQDETGRVLLAVVGLRMTRLATESQLNDWLYQVEWAAMPPLSAQPDSSGVWLVMADDRAFGSDLAAVLGGAVDVVLPGDAYAIIEPGVFQVNPAEADDFRRLFNDGRGAYTGVIFAWGLTADAASDLNQLHEVETLTTVGVLHLVQALAEHGTQPRLWLLTQQSQPVAAGDAVNIAAAPLWGLGAVLANEHAELRVTRLDIDAETPLASWLPELTAEGEDQVAYRAGVRYAARLQPHALETTDPGVTRLVSASEQPFRAEMTTPGVLDNLRLRAMTRRAPAPGEVEIEVVATGLNFKDVLGVMGALGRLPGDSNVVLPIGIECARRIRCR